METTIGEIAMQDNNVITLNVTEQEKVKLTLKQADMNGADFPVHYSDLYLSNGNRVTNKYASVNAHTGDILGVHGKSYKPLTHKHMIENQRDVIAKSGLADMSIIETIFMNPKGTMCTVYHELPNQTIIDPTGEEARLRFSSINSFNNKWAYQIMVGAIRPSCLNGQIFTEGASCIYKTRHNNNLNIDHAADVISKAIPIFMEQSELWHQWHGTDITDNKAALIFAETLNNQTLIDEIYSMQGFYIDTMLSNKYAMPNAKRSKNFMYMWDKWNTHYRNTLGSNLWAVYNTLTDWSTHVQSKTNNVANIQHTRGTKVQRTLNNHDFGFSKAA